MVVRPQRTLRAFFAVALLAAVGAASVVDDEAADFVGGDDGDALICRRREEASLTAGAAPRPSDVSATAHGRPFVATMNSTPPSRRPFAARAAASDSPDVAGVVASAPLPSRAPPAG